MGTSSESASVLIQLPAHGLGKTVENGPRAWAPVAHMGDLDETPDSWLQPGLVVAFQPLDGAVGGALCPSLSLPLCVTLTFKQIH